MMFSWSFPSMDRGEDPRCNQAWLMAALLEVCTRVAYIGPHSTLTNKTSCGGYRSPHRISVGGSLLFMRCVFLTLTGLVSAWRRGETLLAILAKPLSDCVTVFCLRQCKSSHLKVCEILKKIHAIFKQIEYLAFLTEVCVVMWVTPAIRVVVV